MAYDKTGGSAFPREGGANNGLNPDGGMTLRDWFAGQALAGLLGYVSQDDWDAGEFQHYAVAKYVEASFRIADAMLAHGAKENET